MSKTQHPPDCECGAHRSRTNKPTGIPFPPDSPEYRKAYYLVRKHRANGTGWVPKLKQEPRNPPISEFEAALARNWVNKNKAPYGTTIREGGKNGGDWAYWLRTSLHKRARAMKNGKKRPGREIPIIITTRWIREQLWKQGGVCYYTGIPLWITTEIRHPRKPSLDRIDSTRAYTPENVVICCCAVNYLKNDYPLDVFKAMLVAIRDHRSPFTW